jgi:hypothetical protein
MLSVVSLLLGIGLLISGRNMFWLFIGAAGFLTGMEVASRLIPGPAWIGIAISVLLAVAGALLAVIFKKVAIGVAGFLMGSLVLTGLAGLIGQGQGSTYWGFFLVGGVGGIILISLFFDLALIWLSSLVGTALVIEFIPLQGLFRTLAFVVILFIGVIIQSSQWRDDED